MKYVLAYDLGTGSAKAAFINEDGVNLAETVVEYNTNYRAGGICEQKPEDWWNAIVNATQILLSKCPQAAQVEAIGISGHSLGVVAVNKEGKLLAKTTPIWSDARAVEQAERFFKTIDYKNWYETTGCGFPAHLYSLFKIMWYQDNDPKLYEKTDYFIGTKDYINMKLTGVIATDGSYASGSGVYSLKEHRYVAEYMQAAGVEADKFPEVKKSWEVLGTLSPKAAKLLGLPETVKVVCGGVDNTCMSLGAGCFEDGDVYISLGSSAWSAASSKEPVVNFEKKIYTWEHCVPGMYVPSAGIFSAGTALEWFKTNMMTEYSYTEQNPYEELERLAQEAGIGAGGVLFCPTLAGGSGVDVDPTMNGGFGNFHLGTTKGELMRAVLEGIALDLSLAVDALDSCITLSDSILMVGGGTKNKLWRQIHADVLNKNAITTTVTRDAAALGAAALGFYGTGVWKHFKKIKTLHKKGKKQKPIAENVVRYKKIKETFLLFCQQQAQLTKIIKENM